MEESIQTIVEGCMPDTPHQLRYCTTSLVIPQNATLLLSEHPIHPQTYVLYAHKTDNSTISVVNNEYDESDSCSEHPHASENHGWPLTRFEENFRWLYDAQRSVVTKDGRIFVATSYFRNDWRWYLQAVPTIMHECAMLFRGERSIEYFGHNPSRAW